MLLEDLVYRTNKILTFDDSELFSGIDKVAKSDDSMANQMIYFNTLRS